MNFQKWELFSGSPGMEYGHCITQVPAEWYDTETNENKVKIRQ